jgi:aminopeptidase N
VLRGTVASIFQPHQRDLVRPLRDRYFARLDEVWAQRSRSVADEIVIGLFPRTLAEPATVAAADAWLAADHPPALRRHVAEGRADVLRALAAQRCDAAAQPPSRVSPA